MNHAANLKLQKTIRFKVVKAASRYSCMIHGSTKYALKYEKGTTVCALPDTFGIMCFDTYKNAMKLIHQHHYFRENCMVLKVRPRGKGGRPKLIGPLTDLNKFYEQMKKPTFSWERVRTLLAPEGTVCYSAVDVLT